MNTFKKIFLMLVFISMLLNVGYAESICRRVRVTNKDVIAPPGVNAEALFMNIWAFLSILELSPQVLAEVYPQLSSLCFKSFSDRKMKETEYNEVISHISAISGIALEEFSEYRKYDMLYGLTKVQDMSVTFKEEFLSMLNISGNMEPVFEMFQSLIIAEYAAEQARHGLGEDLSRREHVLNLFLWILTGNQNISKADKGWDILKNNKDFILENNSDIVAYALVKIFSEWQQEMDNLIAAKFSILSSEEVGSKKSQERLEIKNARIRKLEAIAMWHAGLIYNLSDRVSLQGKLQEIKAKIENMIIDQNIKSKILSHFPRFIP